MLTPYPADLSIHFQPRTRSFMNDCFAQKKKVYAYSHNISLKYYATEFGHVNNIF